MSDIRGGQLAAAHAVVDLVARDLPAVWCWDVRAEGINAQLNALADTSVITDLQDWATFLGGSDGPLHIRHEPPTPPVTFTRVSVEAEHNGVRIVIWGAVDHTEAGGS